MIIIKRRIIYEIYTPAFCTGFKDLTNKLNYIEELGVTSLWLTPFFKSPSEHGYNVSNYYEIKEQYGTIKDFDLFIEKAHEKNIEVFLDLVLCHTDYHNKLFQESIKGNNNCYFWSDNKIDDKWRICKENNKYYYAPWSHDMPQLNNQSEHVRDMIKDIIKFWLIEHNVDGFRLDAIKYASGNPIEFWKWFCDEVYKIKPNAYLVGECWDTFEVSNKYAKETGMKTFNFEEAGWIKHSLNIGSPLIIENDPKYDVVFLDNHDMSRISNSVGHDMNKLFKAVDMLFSLDGDVCIYYGDEINMGLNQDCHVECGGQGDWKVRRKMEWNEVERQRRDKNSLFNYYKKKIKYYKNN